MFTVVSTFSGCGGSSLGYQMAGGKVLLAVEWDDNAVKTYRANFPDTDIYHGDIAALSVEEVLTRTKLKPRELDIFDGSPPCQGFSTAGKRDFNDNRNQLFKEYCRLLKGLQPKCFVMENVAGMVKGQMKIIFAEILRELKACGYQVRARLLNAENYGVPQSRERMIFIGIRDDIQIEVSHPQGGNKKITVLQALKGVVNKTFLDPNPKYIDLMNSLKPGQNLSKLKKGSFFSYVRAHRDRPCMTITKSVSYGKVSIWHYSDSRNLTIEEAKRIGSFPDNYQLLGSYQDQWARIGNSVPPLLMKAVAEHIKEKVLNGTP